MMKINRTKKTNDALVNVVNTAIGIGIGAIICGITTVICGHSKN